MDRQIKKKKWTLKRISLIGLGVVFFSFVLYNFIWADRRSKLNVDREKITIATVDRGPFQEYIPQTGTVFPKETFYLDAVEGGTIKEVVKESGSMVNAGDVVVVLSNLNRELTVMSQEASYNESINRVRETRLGITQNDLSQKQALAQIDNQLAILQPQYEREKILFEKGLIAKQQFEKTKADYEYNLKRRQFTYESYKTDSIARIRQLEELDESERRMMQSLNGVCKILDNLVIRSPISGQLTTPYLVVGQSINPGQRIGQVDIEGSYKVQCDIDELYSPKISKGLNATFDYNNKSYNLVISYIYPDINNGRFTVDMQFAGESPDGIKRGQSLRLKIALGGSSEELLLPVGGFYKDTGGNWVYVLENDGKAVRRDVRLGRRNTEYFEVLEGLEPGDKVITSSYDNFGDNEVLLLN